MLLPYEAKKSIKYSEINIKLKSCVNQGFVSGDTVCIAGVCATEQLFAEATHEPGLSFLAARYIIISKSCCLLKYFKNKTFCGIKATFYQSLMQTSGLLNLHMKFAFPFL